MKRESTVRYILRISLTLLVITAVVAVALAAVNQVTAPIIAKQNEEKTQQAVAAVLPGGGEPVTGFNDETGLVKNVYRGKDGFAIEVEPQGFNSAITMMVGVDLQGKVTGVSVVSHSETPNLGAVCGAETSAGEAFRGQFVGMSGDLAVTKDGGQVDSITGATITSRAVTRGINAALDCVTQFLCITAPLE